MNAFRIDFILKSAIEINDDSIEPIWDYLGCLYKNGQILKNYVLIECETGLWALVTLPDDSALDEKNNNIYVDKYLLKVKEHFNVSVKLLGSNMNQSESCGCESPSWYMLYTDWTLWESPVVCGDCGMAVPLYKSMSST